MCYENVEVSANHRFVQQSFSEVFITPCNHSQLIQASHRHQNIQ